MKKSIFTILFIALISLNPIIAGSNSSAQSATEVQPMFNQGDVVINLGLGLGTVLYTGRAFSQRVPPLSLSLEYGYMEDFIAEDLTLGLGGYLGFASAKWESRYANWGWDYTYIILGGRAGLHYPIVENFDTYAGVMLGFNVVSSSSFGTVDTGRSAAGSGLVFSLYAGGRYYLSEQFAFMAEIGYGIAYLNLGIAYKL